MSPMKADQSEREAGLSAHVDSTATQADENVREHVTEKQAACRVHTDDGSRTGHADPNSGNRDGNKSAGPQQTMGRRAEGAGSGSSGSGSDAFLTFEDAAGDFDEVLVELGSQPFPTGYDPIPKLQDEQSESPAP
jgi:hypothetical protein